MLKYERLITESYSGSDKKAKQIKTYISSDKRFCRDTRLKDKTHLSAKLGQQLRKEQTAAAAALRLFEREAAPLLYE